MSGVKYPHTLCKPITHRVVWVRMQMSLYTYPAIGIVYFVYCATFAYKSALTCKWFLRMAKTLRYPARPRSTSTSPRERLLSAATKLFCRHGINSVGVDAIVDEAGTAKATLYNIFGSKDALACEVLDNEGLRWRNWMFKGIDSFESDAKSKLLHIFDLLRVWFSNREYFGCPFINTVAQHDKRDSKMRDIALAHKKIVLDRIRELVFEAGIQNPEETAHELGIIIDGAIVAALITRDPKVADVAGNVAKALIEARTGDSRRLLPEICKV